MFYFAINKLNIAQSTQGSLRKASNLAVLARCARKSKMIFTPQRIKIEFDSYFFPLSKISKYSASCSPSWSTSV